MPPELSKSESNVIIQTIDRSEEQPSIFHYAYNSDYVVVAMLDKLEPVASANKKEDGQSISNLEDSVAGVLYSFRVERLLCSKESFSLKGDSPPNLLQKFQIFVAIEKNFEESYAKGQRYLIFLRALPNQEKLAAIYELDKSKNYFEAFEGYKSIFSTGSGSLHSPPKKGIVEMSNLKYQDLIEKIEIFCSALNGTDKNMKIKKLQKLTKSSDEQLRSNAIYAIKALQDF